MPVPTEYQRASQEFAKFMLDAREAAGLTTTHQTYTMVQGVFQTFRRRLTLADAIRFAGVLPPLLRALFVADWDTNEPKREFEDRLAMTREVQSLRAAHNFAPDSSIRDVASALRSNVLQPEFDQMLAALPPGAAQFWSI